MADAISPLGYPQTIADSNDKDKAVEKSLSTKGAKAKRQGNALFLRPVRQDALKGHERVNPKHNVHQNLHHTSSE